MVGFNELQGSIQQLHAATSAGLLVTQDKSGAIRQEKPVNPPGVFAKLVASISNLGKLESWDPVRKARENVASYQTQQESSRRYLSGLVKSLRASYDGIGSVDAHLPDREGKRLTARTVIDDFNKFEPQLSKRHNNQTRIEEYLNAKGGKSRLTDVFREKGVTINGPEETANWRSGLSETEKKYFTRFFEHYCQARPEALLQNHIMKDTAEKVINQMKVIKEELSRRGLGDGEHSAILEKLIETNFEQLVRDDSPENIIATINGLLNPGITAQTTESPVVETAVQMPGTSTEISAQQGKSTSGKGATDTSQVPSNSDQEVASTSNQSSVPAAPDKAKAEAKFALQSQSNRTITKFLDTVGASSRKERTMDDLFVAQGRATALPKDSQEVENHWSALVHTHVERRFLVDYIERQCKELPEYNLGKLSNTQVAKAAENAIGFMNQVRSIPKISEEQVSKIYLQVGRLGKEAIDLLNKTRSIQNLSIDSMLEIYLNAVQLETPEKRSLAAEGTIIDSSGNIKITL